MNKTPGWSQEKYINAFHFAALAHRGQLYPGTDLPYLIHISLVGMEVIAALSVEQVANPDLAVQCALLHDVIEDTNGTFEEIKEVFGNDVARGLCALSKDKTKEKELRLADSLERIQNEPREVWMVKLSDRIANLQSPPFHWDQEKIRSYWRESKEIHLALKSSSSFLAERLSNKINNYTKYINNTSA